jgi:hypothetical protein
MTAIIEEGVLFLVLLAVAAALVVFVVRYYTAAGRALEQSRNRKQIDRALSLTCERHGPHDERAMVRLESGEVMCPECYREAMDGRV